MRRRIIAGLVFALLALGFGLGPARAGGLVRTYNLSPGSNITVNPVIDVPQSFPLTGSFTITDDQAGNVTLTGEVVANYTLVILGGIFVTSIVDTVDTYTMTGSGCIEDGCTVTWNPGTDVTVGGFTCISGTFSCTDSGFLEGFNDLSGTDDMATLPDFRFTATGNFLSSPFDPLGTGQAIFTYVGVLEGCTDTDGDTLCDDEDPCKTFANTLPLVISGFSGIPDECLCGDFDGDGFHSATDAAAVNDCAAFISFACVPERDEVTPPFDGFYSATDADVINQVAAFIIPAYKLTCGRRPEGTCGGDTGVACF